MNKSDLIRKITRQSNLSRDEVARFVNALFECIQEVLVKEGSITITGLGNFSLKKMSARTGRNPRTGEQIKIGKRNRVSFKASKILMDRFQESSKTSPVSKGKSNRSISSKPRAKKSSTLRRSMRGPSGSRVRRSESRDLEEMPQAPYEGMDDLYETTERMSDSVDMETMLPEPMSETEPQKPKASQESRQASSTSEQSQTGRFFQASVQKADEANKNVTVLSPEEDYKVNVFIGKKKKEEGWLGGEEKFDGPPPKPDGSPHKLHVFFWEPDVCSKPQVQSLDLWSTGDTDICTFSFHSQAREEWFSARISVYHGSRNLQTGLLRGRVGGPEELSFILDAAPLPRFSMLQDSNDVAASIILDEGGSGQTQACVYADGKAEINDMGDPEAPTDSAIDISVAKDSSLDQLIKTLGRQITSITRNPDDFEGLEKEGTRELLVELAQRGATLLERLQKHSRMGDNLKDAYYIQVVRAHMDSFCPVEFFYEGEPPDDNAIICDGAVNAGSARQALGTGKCCGAYKSNSYKTVCPLRFWSLSKVIERHAHLPEHTDIGGQFQFRNTIPHTRAQTLEPLNGAVMAVSDRVEKPGTVAKLQARLSGILGGTQVPLAKDWDEWAEQINKVRPHLLVMLPHHENTGGDDVLEIGGEMRKTILIRPSHVRPTGSDDLAPVVLLLGCDTNQARINLENSVTQFQDKGAAIVVSTIGSILGRDAGPAASTIVEEISKAVKGASIDEKDITFGEAMLAARRRLLAEGVPMVLGVTSYGGADWLIAERKA